jgi:hypothetical protein
MLVVGALIGLAAFALSLPVAGAHPRATSATDTVTVSFSGSVRAHYFQDFGNGVTWTNDLAYTWRETTVVPVNSSSIPLTGQVDDVLTGSGSLHVRTTGQSPLNCTEQYRESAHGSSGYAVSAAGVRVATVRNGEEPLQVTASMPIAYYTVTHNCPSAAHIITALSEEISVAVQDKQFSCVLRREQSCTQPFTRSGSFAGDYTYTVTANFSARRSGTAGAPPPPKTTPAPKPSGCLGTDLRRAVKAQLDSEENTLLARLAGLYYVPPSDEEMISAFRDRYLRQMEEEKYGVGLCRLIDSVSLEEFDFYTKGRKVQQVAGPATGASKPLLTLRATFRKGKPGAVTVTLDHAQRTALRRLMQPVTLTVTGTARLVRGAPVSVSRTRTIRPAASKSTPAITSVRFGGSSAGPTFAVLGTGLGARPKPNPPGHPAGQNGCPSLAGDDGYDYGTSLYVAVPAKNWSGGRYLPGANETDCIDLVVTRFTATEVDFHFGPFYVQHNAQFSLNDGDQVEIAVNGAVKRVHVKYGATATS